MPSRRAQEARGVRQQIAMKRSRIYLGDRERELLISARAQIAALIEGPPPLAYGSDLYVELTKIQAQIEHLLGY